MPQMIRIPCLLALGLLAAVAEPLLASPADEHYRAGLELYEQGDHAKAVPHLRAAVQMDPSHWRAYQVLGYTHYRMGDREAALRAIDRSLELHPDNPALRAFADKIRPSMPLPPVDSATAPPPETPSTPVKTPLKLSLGRTSEVPEAFTRRNFLEVRFGPGWATLGDFQGASAAWNAYYSTGPYQTSSLDQSGLFVGVLGGLALDPRNAIGAEATLGFFGGFRGEAIDEFGDYYYDSYTPKMLAGEFKYLHSFSTGGSRVRAEVGAGFYGTILQMSAESDYYSLYGQMAGFGFGGSLGLAWQLVLGDSVTFETYARGRLATTSRIKGESSLGEIGLAKTDEGLVWWDFASYIESGGAEWANVDYTGFEGGVAIAFHY